MFTTAIEGKLEQETLQRKKCYSGREQAKGMKGDQDKITTGIITALHIHTFQHQHQEVSHWTIIIDDYIVVFSLECLIIKHKLTKNLFLLVSKLLEKNEFRVVGFLLFFFFSSYLQHQQELSGKTGQMSCSLRMMVTSGKCRRLPLFCKFSLKKIGFRSK